ncbi:MAG: COX15/CtaA family protein, partial [Alphaproteobacteria bacterium]
LGPRARLAVNLAAVAALVQPGLGIATLLLVVPVPLAAAHQAGALVLLGLLVWILHELKAPRDRLD